MKNFLKENASFHILIICSLVLVTRIIFLLSPLGHTIDSDEAIFGLMALKIEAMEEFPIYVWEAHYSGTFIAYVAALLFHLFGSGPLLLRSVLLPLALLSSSFFYLVYRQLFGASLAFFASLFLTFCPFVVLYYTSIAVNYGELYLGTALIMFLSLKLKEGISEKWSLFLVFLLGLACGFYFYALFLVLPAIIAFAFPAVISLKKNRLKNILSFSAGGLIGLLPFIVYNLKTHGGSFIRAGGRILSTGRADMDVSLSAIIGKIMLNKMDYFKTWLTNAPKTFGLYLLPESLGDRALSVAGIFLIFVFVLFILYVFVGKAKKTDSDSGRLFAFYFILLILLQWFASLESPRHLLPLLIVIPVVFMALSGNRKTYTKISISLLCLFAVLQLTGWPERLRQPFFDPYPIVPILKGKGIKEFYGQYWTVYPIMFAGKGEFIGSPLLLPYHEPLADRLPKCTLDVRRSLKAAYVFTKGENGLEEKFLRFIKDHKITYESIAVGETNIYFNLSKPVDTLVDAKRNSYFILKPSVSSSVAP